MASILIAGGSLGGLMVANLLWRAGHQVQVLEKAVGAMDGRGAGIVTHPLLVRGLQRCGMAPDETLGVTVQKRVVLGTDGQRLAELPMPQVLTSWSRLYHLLHELLPAECYRQGVTVQGVRLDKQAHVQTSAGPMTADLLLAADGIRSVVRSQLWPQVQPEYAGYVAWRGMCDESVLSRFTQESLFPYFGFSLPPGEQMLGYPVAGAGNRMEVGQRAYSLVWYRPATEPAQLQRLLTDADGVHHAQGIPPQKVSWREMAHMREDARRLLAPQFAEMMEKTAQPFLQPIFDLSTPSLNRGPVALLGDAAFVARPHVGVGVTKAMQDAVTLADAISQHGATPLALQAYSEQRVRPGQQVLERSRQLGAYLQTCGSAANHTPSRDALMVLRDTAIDPEAPQTVSSTVTA